MASIWDHNKYHPQSEQSNEDGGSGNSGAGGNYGGLFNSSLLTKMEKVMDNAIYLTEKLKDFIERNIK